MNEGNIVNFAAIKTKGTRPPVEVEIKSLGGTRLWIKRLSAIQRDQYERSVVDAQGKLDLAKVEGARSRFVAMAVINPTTMKPIASAEEWQELDGDVIAEINKEAQRVNGMGAEEIEEAGKD